MYDVDGKTHVFSYRVPIFFYGELACSPIALSCILYILLIPCSPIALSCILYDILNHPRYLEYALLSWISIPLIYYSCYLELIPLYTILYWYLEGCHATFWCLLYTIYDILLYTILYSVILNDIDILITRRYLEPLALSWMGIYTIVLSWIRVYTMVLSWIGIVYSILSWNVCCIYTILYWYISRDATQSYLECIYYIVYYIIYTILLSWIPRGTYESRIWRGNLYTILYYTISVYSMHPYII